MSTLTVTDNSDSQFHLPEYKGDLENLRKISGQTIGDLAEKNFSLLVFPPEMQTTQDKIEDETIFTIIKESSEDFTLKTGNIMGFIGICGAGRKRTELNITSRFTPAGQDSGDHDSKIPDFFLHYMLQKVCHINLLNLPHGIGRERILDLLPFFFPHYLKAALRQGLYKEYQTFARNDPNVRGTIDIKSHIRFNIPFNGKIAYKMRKHSFDNPITELVRHTIENLSENANLKSILYRDKETREAVAWITAATPLYDRSERQKILSKTVRPIQSPYFAKYRNLQKICRMILLREKIRYKNSGEKNQFYGILFNGAWLWEEYLAMILKKPPLSFIHPENKSGKGGIYLFQKEHGNSANTARGQDRANDEQKLAAENETAGSNIDEKHFRYRRYPDFYHVLNSNKTRKNDGNPKADWVLDAKYKQLENCVPREDLFQVISYMHVLQAENGGFIFPIKSDGIQLKRKSLGTLCGYGGTMQTIGIPCNHTSGSFTEYHECMEKIEKEIIEMNL